MALPIISKTRQKWITLITALIPIKTYRKALRGILLLGVSKYKKVIKTDKTKKFKHTLSITAIMKNEGAYLKEWLDYHILVGVDKFYLYDNGSTDNTTEILKPYIKKGIVDYKYWPGKAQQMLTYQDSINKHAKDTRWMAIIDLDEFLVPVNHDTVSEFLYTLPQNFAQLVITWIIYGSSGHIHKPDGLVIENFKKHADKTWGVKSIVNPRLVYALTNPHVHKVAGFIIDENGKKLGYIDQTNNPPAHDKLRCNHYYTKSRDEYIERLNRGSATTEDSKTYRGLDKFEKYDRNEIYDTVMDRFIKKLKHGKK